MVGEVRYTQLSRGAALLAVALGFAPVAAVRAQDPMAGMDMSGQQMPGMMGPLGISMERMGSGTTWIPDAVTLPSVHLMGTTWNAMLHGFVFGQYDWQEGPRGDTQFGSLNWGMLMASRKLGGGWLQLRTMLSLDPATVTGRGYPLLLQTGESYRGEPLRDRQHPHDFLMEIAALYERPVGEDVALSLYVAPSGEPALGPVAFMHRPSAMDDPVAPLSHHWQDATHIAFGVVTVGMFSQWWKLEGSLFNGEEPDDRRWNIDPIRLDSYAARVTLNPNANWSMTAGYGSIDSPSPSHPGTLRRFVASALHGRRIGESGQWASALIYGVNDLDDHEITRSILAESEMVIDDANTVFGRAELVEKSGEELVTDAIAPDELARLGHVTFGYVRELWKTRGATVGLGVRGTMNLVPDELEATYGSRTPLGAMVFLRLRPARAPASPGQQGMPHHHPPLAERMPATGVEQTRLHGLTRGSASP